jgi:hypothetical protein
VELFRRRLDDSKELGEEYQKFLAWKILPLLTVDKKENEISNLLLWR